MEKQLTEKSKMTVSIMMLSALLSVSGLAYAANDGVAYTDTKDVRPNADTNRDMIGNRPEDLDRVPKEVNEEDISTVNASDADDSDAVSNADNTGINARDRNNQAVTPFDQSETESDRKMTQEIRQRIMGNQSLSMNAKNVKIITTQQKVTLRGPVDNANEKQVIEKIAKDIAGPQNVNNLIEVKAR